MTEPSGVQDALYHYAIRIQGHLDSHWSAWFEGMTIRHVGNDTILEGPVTDQSALHGLLAKLRSLNLSLISVQCLDCASDDGS